MNRLDRYKGSMLGFAIGDALGATVEFMSPAQIKQKYGVHKDIIGGGWLGLPKGAITDDTEMTLCVARSLVECHGFNLKDIANRFANWYNSNPPDIGSTCRYGIHHYIKTGELEAPYDEHGAGNGGVMRELPLILYFTGDCDRMMETVVAQSRMTHNNRESDQGCRCYADMVSHALSGASKDELRKVAANYPLFSPEHYEGKSGGYIVETLRTVLHYFFLTISFEECIIATVNNGQDADTTGALAGGLAGAFYSLNAIPVRWLDILERQVCKETDKLAEALFEID